VGAGCEPAVEKTGEPAEEFEAGYSAWEAARMDEMQGEESWLSLAGLFWLEPGQYRFGASPANEFVLATVPAPPVIGTFFVDDDSVRFEADPSVDVTREGTAVSSLVLVSDAGHAPTELASGTLRWSLIERDGMLGIRVRDLEHPDLVAFDGIDTYPVDVAWAVRARYEPFETPQPIVFPTVLGTMREEEAPGRLYFEIEGVEYHLDPVPRDGDRYFLVFGDDTNARETYGAGRFLYTDMPGPDGTTVIDFNRAYNPPCAFTAYSTCPQPPQQNRLSLQVTAGEKMYHPASLSALFE
jgi:uncharacterized protein (DUF1684 family)